MELTVFRQTTKTREDGTKVYKGEDASPYVDDRLFFVADGMGGRGAIYHQSFKRELFEPDKLLDTLFAGVFDDYADERFVRYVTNSFFELYGVKHCYFSKQLNMKKSGYFGSRILAALLLHAALYIEDLQPENLFAKYHEQSSPKKREALLKELGDRLAELFQAQLRQVARNANLVYESSLENLALLGTTLCATIYRETEDAVEAIYLHAGDSRPYIWTERDGLCQLIEDQEGEDGAMTNYIRANEGESFGISCYYRRFPKPCVLFNASDGAFELKYYRSQMTFEKFILDAAVGSKDTAEMSEKLCQAFYDYGRADDDSSTIAMKMFGYESFEAFQKSCAARLDALNAAYLSKLPELLERDYAAEFEEASREKPDPLASVKGLFESEEAVCAYCVEAVKSGRDPRFAEKNRVLDEKIAAAARKIEEAEREIEEQIKRNFSRFRSLQPHEEAFGERLASDRIADKERKFREQTEKYLSKIKEYREQITEMTEQMRETIDQVVSVGVPKSYLDFQGVSFSEVFELEEALDEVFCFFENINNKKHPIISKLLNLRSDFIQENQNLANKHREELRQLRELAIAGKLDLKATETCILPHACEELQDVIERIREARKLLASLETEEKDKLVEECRKAYWDEHYTELIPAIVGDPKVPISEDLRAATIKLMKEAETDLDELKAKAELQAALFAKYEELFKKYLQEKTESFHGYELISDWKNSSSGQIARAQKDGKIYFLKKYQTPVAPIDNGTLDARTFEYNRKKFDAFVRMRRILNQSLRVCTGESGSIVVPCEEFIEGNHFVEASEFMEGVVPKEELDGVLASLPFAAKKLLMQTAAGALHVVHSLHIVHSDVNLSNLQLVRNQAGEYVTKLIDFDSSYPVDKKPEELFGTIEYYSPELGMCISAEDDREELEKKLTEKSDVFSLGLVFHYYLSGCLPTPVDLPEELRKRQEQGKPVFCWAALNNGGKLQLSPEIQNPECVALIRDMLSPDPDARPSAAEVLTRLAGISET